MISIDAHFNVFGCTPVINAAAEECYVDSPSGVFTQRNDFHACLPGYWMRGLNLTYNEFTCCRGGGVTLNAETVRPGQDCSRDGPAEVLTGDNHSGPLVSCAIVSR
jgi:hypothetical protein